MSIASLATWKRRANFRFCLLAAFAGAALASGCASTGLSDMTAKVASVGDVFAAKAPTAPHQFFIFVASTRKGERGPASETAVDGGVRLSLQMISVPPDHAAGEIERPSFGSPDAGKHFVAMSRRELDDASFQRELATHISGRIGSNRDILLYVHGFNTSYEEARFRLAQIAEDGRFGGVPVLFTWPSGSLLDYEAARESATASRDALGKLIRELAAVPEAGRVQILAHSMGTWLTMEALRENAIAGSPDLDGRLGNVMLAAPDIDLSVFRQQIARLDASHVSVLVSAKDRALSISRTLAGDRPRVGALDPRNANDRAALDRLGVKVYDLSALSTGLIGHGTYADAPQVVRSIGARIGEARPQDADKQAVLGERPVSSASPGIDTQPLPAPGAAASATPAE